MENVPFRWALEQGVRINALTVPVGYKKDFDEIQTKFAHLFYDITTMLEEAPEVTLEELKKFLIFYRDLKPLLQEADTITKVMLVVEEHSSFINCTYLKAVADNFLKTQEGQKKLTPMKSLLRRSASTHWKSSPMWPPFLLTLHFNPSPHALWQ